MRTGREYLRVSQDQSGRMRSPTEQHAENVDAAQSRGVDLLAPYQEAKAVGASRHSRGRRDDFAQLLVDLRTGAFGADELWLWEHSRGSRKVGEWVTLIEACESADVHVWVTTHRRVYDPSNARDRRSLLEDAVDSEYESGKISERARRAARANAVAGRPHGKHLYGYRRAYDPKTRALLRVVLDEVAAPIVAEIFTRFADGEGAAAIALDLTHRDVRVPADHAYQQRTGTPPERLRVWRHRTVCHLLANEGFLGHRVSAVGHARVDNAWPAVIDEVTWWRCKARLDGRTPSPSYAARHLLSGLVTCGKPGCDSPMTYHLGAVHGGPPKPNYVCVARSHNSRKAGQWSPNLEQCDGLEGQVVEAVLRVWDADQRLDRTSEDPRVGELAAALSAMNDRLADYRKAGASADGPSPAAVAVVEQELAPKIAATQRQLDALRAHDVLPDLGGLTLREVWALPESHPRHLPLAQRRTIIAASVAITVLPTSRGVRYDPDKIVITPRW